MENDNVKIVRAINYVAEKRASWFRNGKLTETDLSHATRVARILTEATGGNDPDLVVAGLLLDVTNDRQASHDELLKLFGKDIAELVLEAAHEVSTVKSDRAKMLRIAHITGNLDALLNSAPESWDKAWRNGYFDWAQEVVGKCRGVNAVLDDLFDKAHRNITQIDNMRCV